MSIPVDILPPLSAAYLIGLAALVGACLGSFMNCLAWRVVNGQSVLRGRSHCPACEHSLSVLDLVPVLSWVFLRGKCRYCKAKIPARYVLVEVLCAAVFVVLVMVHGLSIPTLAYMALACVLVGLSLVDLDTFTIPNGFVLAVIAVWVASVCFMQVPANSFGVGSMFAALVGYGWLAVALDGLAGAVAIGGGMLVFSLLFDAVTKRTSLGGGDVKLLFAVGLFLGLAGSLLNLLVACVFGLVFALVRGLSVSSAGSQGLEQPASPAEDEPPESIRTKAIPFGPAIAAATIFTILVGPVLLTWYTSLFL